MTDTNACFISYPHLGDPSAEEFIEEFVKQLKTRLALHCRTKPVFYDKDRLAGGDFVDAKIAEALCKSACMVIFFVTHNFDSEHPYCAMEYLAMKNLEAERIKLVELNNAG
ncbi:MAG: toll/interleukin-1 receptor domain-containing protein, partial [Burkholderiales bacterium]|nr:toll/interleukin-1 receptor domain-containing protein [Burkholderiales bacterium]